MNDNSMQSLQMKLFGAIGAFLAACVLLVGSTLAWFTVSNAPEIQQVNVNVSSAKNFEIARATTGKDAPPTEVTWDDMSNPDPETTWGQTITFGGEEGSDVELSLDIPATIDGGVLKTTTFDENGSGRTAGLIEVGELGEMENGIAFYTEGSGDEAKNCAAVMGFWLRTNTTGGIQITIPEDSVEVTGGNAGSAINMDMVGIGVKIGESGDFVPVTPGADSFDLGVDLEASTDGTYCEMIVYLNGGDENSENGVVAYDIGGDEDVKITIKDIKFNNENVPEDENA